MKTVTTLPEGYGEILTVDLQKDKKLSLCINLAALVMMAVLGTGMHFWIPITTFFEFENGFWQAMLRPIILLVSYVAYILLHEAVHGVAMKLCGSKKVKYGFTGPYAYAGSEDYYGKRAYLFIALAPVVLWGIVLGVLCVLVPRDWFWVVWFVQIGNLSGAVGDFYVTFKFLRMPREILVQDSGVRMTVYVPHDEKE